MSEGFKTQIELGLKDMTGGALKGIGGELKDISKDLKGIGRIHGLPRLGEMFKGVSRSMWDVAKSSGRVLANLTGIGTIGVAGVFVGLTAALKGSAAKIDEISKKARELKMPMQTLREFAHVAGLQGVSWEAATGGLQAAGKTYFELQNGIGRAKKQLAAINPVLAQQIKHAKDSAGAIDIMLEAVHKAGSAEEAAKLSELFFGTTEFTKVAELSGAEFAAAMDNARKILGTITDEQGRAIEETNDSIDNFKGALSGLRDQLATDLWPALRPVVDRMTDWVSVNREWIATGIGDALKEIGATLRDADWKQIGADIASIFSGISSAFGAIRDTINFVKPAIEGIADLGRGMVGIWRAEMDAVVGIGKAAADAIRTALSIDFYGIGKGWLEDLWAGISSVKDLVLNEVKGIGSSIANSLTGLLPSFLQPDAPAGQPLPRRARGGRVDKGRWTLVGEEGPELLRVGSSGHVFPAGQTRALLGTDDPDRSTRALARALLEPARIVAEPLKPLEGMLKDLKDAIDELSDTGLVASGGAQGSGPGARRGRRGGRGGRGAAAGGVAAGHPGAGGTGATGNAFLDLIGRAEGTDKGRGYNETLSYGAYTGGPRDLVTMTLDEIDAMQGEMLAHPANRFNSSAAGRYQIVRKTLRALRRKLGLTGRELYDKGMQDRLALELANGRGADVAGLRNEWEGLRHVGADEILSAYRAKDRPSPAIREIAEDRSERFRPALRTPPASRQQVDIGKGEVRVTIDRDGRVTGVKPSGEGNLVVKAGFDRTGQQFWTPRAAYRQ